MSELGGNPNVQNARGETSLHCLCAVESKLSDEQKSDRQECLIILMNFKEIEPSNIEPTKSVDLCITDYVSTFNVSLVYCLFNCSDHMIVSISSVMIMCH